MDGANHQRVVLKNIAKKMDIFTHNQEEKAEISCRLN